MVDMEKKREKLVAGLTRRHMIRSGSSSSSSPTAAAAAADNNKNMSEGGDLNLISRQKKGKAKVLKWRLSNTDMDMKGEEGGSDGDYDDTVLSSLTTASFSSLISRKRVKSLGKVAEDCDAIDPPVPRKLRSAINKRASQTVSTSPRHVKKRRHLSAISSQTFLMDRETRCNAIPLANHFSKEEEVVVDALLSLSQIPHLCELSSDRGMAEDNLDLNVTSVSYSAGATKVDEKISALPTAGTEVANQPALDEPVERTGNVSQINHVPCGGTCNNTNPTLSNDGQIHDISLGIVTNLPSPSKDYNNSRKQLKVQFDNSTIHPTKIEAPRCLENSKKPDILEHDRKNVKNNTAQEIVPPVQTSKPCASHRPSSNTLASCNNTAAETVKGTGEHENLSLVNKNGTPSKTWKRSITHVYMCHLIQMHLDKEKASQNRVKPEEVCHSHISRSPDGSTISKNGAQDEKFYALHFDVRLPVQPSCSVCDTTIARQKMVSGNFLNLPTSAALSGVQHVQYLHPPIAPRGAMPYPIQHLPYTRGNLTHTALLLQQQMPQYMCNPNPAIMKIQQQLMPNHTNTSESSETESPLTRKPHQTLLLLLPPFSSRSPRAARLRRRVPAAAARLPRGAQPRSAPPPPPMAASLVHAAAASASPAPAARVGAFHPLASSSPFLRLACATASSPSTRRRRCLDAPLRALSAGSRLAAGWGAPRTRRVIATFAGEESVGSESGDDKEKGKGEMKPEEAQEVWKEMLKQFKDEAQRMHGLTLQAYGVYSQRAREVLLEASEKLKIHADKAQKDLSVIATEVGEEGQEYLKLAAQNSPDSIKDIIETFNSLGKLKISEYEDYHVGIPFGTFLTVGGFLNFMLTGRTSAIRFGIILGFALLAMGISSLRSQRAGGRRPRLLLKGQAAIASVIFFRELLIFFHYGWFPNIFVVLLSGAVTAFYTHRIMTGGHKGPSSESTAEN